MNYSEKSKILADQLWAIANELRGNMDASKFKDYILGFLFYRYLSLSIEKYYPNLVCDVDYLTATEDQERKLEKDIRPALGYYIPSKSAFPNLIKEIAMGKEYFDKLEAGMYAFRQSAKEAAEERARNDTAKDGNKIDDSFSEVFSSINLSSPDLGKDTAARKTLVANVLCRINEIDLSDDSFDAIGTAYMILIEKFGTSAGKKEAEFYTPTCLSKLVAGLATSGISEIQNIYDPCAGSGSLMLHALKNPCDVYAQEKQTSTYNLLLMNLMVNGIYLDQLNTYNGDTLKDDRLADKKFHIQVANPPFSAAHGLTEDDLNDPRFSGAAVIPPKTHSDLPFVEHIISHMADDGRAAVLISLGALFRGGKEKVIRQYILEECQCLDAVIALPTKLFHTTSVPVACLVFDKKKTEKGVYFINAEECFHPGKKFNEMTEADINKVIKAYESRKDIDWFARNVSMKEIRENDYNLNVPRFIGKEPEPEIDLPKNISDIKEITKEIQKVSDRLKESYALLGIEFPL